MPERKHVILVGSSKFPAANGALESLPSASNDVYEMQRVLSDPDVGGFTDVHLLLDLPHYEVMLQINQVFRKADREDEILLYYSGHGELDSAGTLHLATINTDPELLHATAIPTDAIRAVFRETRCRRIIAILDCCYSGAIGDLDLSFRHGEDGINQSISDGYAVSIMVASAAVGRAYTVDGDAHGLLTKHILEGIRSGDADTNSCGVITMDELCAYVSEKVSIEASQAPFAFNSGATENLMIARTRARVVNTSTTEQIAAALDEAKRSGELPEFVHRGASAILAKSEDEIHEQHELIFNILHSWFRDKLNTTELVNQWYQFENTGLPSTDKPSEISDVADRWETVRQCRRPIHDLVGPSYILDRYFRFLDWNPMFDELVAKPMGLTRGRHVEDFILKLSNRQEVIERSRKLFSDGQFPMADVEPLEFASPRYGLIRFQKIAAQVPSEAGGILAWSVNLNVVSAEKDEELWADLERRLCREVNWSKYAKLYDKMLLNFDSYQTLVSDVVEQLGDAAVVADFASGTGNVTIEMLKQQPERSVWALESNEEMLEHMRDKLSSLDTNQRERVTIFKGDLLVSLREFEANSFDGAVMLNALYAMEDRAHCLREIYRVLKPGGVLVYCTSTTETNLERLFDAINNNMEEKDLTVEMREVVDSAYDSHLEMKDMILKDTHDDVVRYARSAGFRVGDGDVVEKAYEGAVTIVKAEKPEYVAEVLPYKPEVPPPPRVDAEPSVNRVFISYAHDGEGAQWCDRIRKYLMPAIQSGELEVWSDHDIDYGENWGAEIQENLASSTTAILLVCQNFLASSFIRNSELPALLHRAKTDGVLIIPVLLQTSMFEHAKYKYPDPRTGPEEFYLHKLQTAASPTEPMEALSEPEQNLVLNKIANRILARGRPAPA